jgi:hypothetical protein
VVDHGFKSWVGQTKDCTLEFVASSVNMHLSLKAYSHSDWFSFLYWKLPIFDVLYQLQLKFFIISYVFNLERRKYVAVWFFISRKEFNVYQHDIHIFMNMIIWPLMTYTVTSFGKAFAHVRNCLLKIICSTICLQFSLYWAPLQSLGLFLLISSRIFDFKCHSY